MVSESRQYEVLGLLGAGAFGTVYRARYIGEHGFSKEVALKVLNPQVEDVAELAERLRDEARMLGLIRHRAIVQVDRLIRTNGRWAVVMECVDGVDLQNVIRHGPLPIGAAIEIAAEVASALHAAQSQPGPDGQPIRLLHRDIKPSNIVITRHAEVKVLDFGIARADFASRETRTRSMVFGTPAYMPPERLDFQPDGPEGDVYALAAVLYELLTGKRLGLSSANPGRHQVKLMQAREVLVQQDGVVEPVAELVCLALDYERTARPSAGEFAQRLMELGRGVEGPTLRSWAKATLPALLSERDQGVRPELDPDALTFCVSPDISENPTLCEAESREFVSNESTKSVSVQYSSRVKSGNSREASAPELAPARRRGPRTVLVVTITVALAGTLSLCTGIQFPRRHAGDQVSQLSKGLSPVAEASADDPVVLSPPVLVGPNPHGGDDQPPISSPPNTSQATTSQPGPGASEQLPPTKVVAPPEEDEHLVTPPPPVPTVLVTVRGDPDSVEWWTIGTNPVSIGQMAGPASLSLEPALYRYRAKFTRYVQPVEGCLRVDEHSAPVLNCSAEFGNCRVTGAEPCL